MRAVVITAVFPPEPVVSARTSFDVARGLATRGHDVTVLAPFPNRPAGRIYAGFRRRLFRSDRGDGFRIIRCFAFISATSSMRSRFAENISFGLTAALRLLFLRRPDVLYLNTWPVFATSLAVMVARARRIPTIISVQDIYPESLVAQGRLASSSIVHRAVLAVDRFVVRKAAGVILISPQFARRYTESRGLDESTMHVVPNWLSHEGTEVSPGAGAECRARNGIPADAFLLSYGGNVGAAAGVETIIETFARPGLDPNVHLLVAGQGMSLAACRRLALQTAPDRIHFEPDWDGGMSVLHAADAVVLPTRGAQSAASVPSKLINYLFSARPVIAMALEGSATEQAVREAGCGMVIPPDDPRRFAESVAVMVAMPAEERREMGRAGRAWALANVTRDICLPAVLDLLEAKAAHK